METVKIQVPETQADITLEQYQRYQKLCEREDLKPREFNQRKLMIFTGMTFRQVEKIEISDYANLLHWVDLALTSEVPFVPRFTHNGIEYGIIPNFDEMTSGEFFDLTMYEKEDESLHKLMAVLFRPITAKDALGNYQIESYTSADKYADAMKSLPMNVVQGAIFFFRNLRMELSRHTLQSLEVANQREAERSSSSSNGGGLSRLTKWLKGKFGSTTR